MVLFLFFKEDLGEELGLKEFYFFFKSFWGFYMVFVLVKIKFGNLMFVNLYCYICFIRLFYNYGEIYGLEIYRLGVSRLVL